MIATKKYMEKLSECYNLDIEMAPFIEWYRAHLFKIPKHLKKEEDYRPEHILELYRQDCKLLEGITDRQFKSLKVGDIVNAYDYGGNTTNFTIDEIGKDEHEGPWIHLPGASGFRVYLTRHSSIRHIVEKK